jgi:hypothetical protein
MDPANPEILYAALYARQRTPWSFNYGIGATNGEDAGGIFKSTNGGGAWKKLGGGLPGQTGRIGLAISASNPKVVMAIVQSDEGGSNDIRDIHSKAGGVFRSEDAGETWTRMNDINPRPFYFSEIKVDPANDQRIYVLGQAVLVSMTAAAASAKTTPKSASGLPRARLSCRAARLRPNRRNPKTRTSRPSRLSRSGCC